MDLSGKKVMVLGLARTGQATARFLAEQGAVVLVSDLRPTADLQAQLNLLSGLPIQYQLGGEDLNWLEGVDMLVPSPGVPMNNLLLQEAGRRGVEIISEIELAYRSLLLPLIAITGTDGKSATTTLIGASPCSLISAKIISTVIRTLRLTPVPSNESSPLKMKKISPFSTVTMCGFGRCGSNYVRKLSP